MRIKICGITRALDADSASRLGVDALGLNFYSGSPRHITATTAATIVTAISPDVEPVGLFVNESLASAVAVLEPLERIRTIQWHGDEPPRDRPATMELIPAFAIRSGHDLLAVHSYLEECSKRGWLPLAVLLDGHGLGRYGGTGQQAPWSLLAEFRPRVPVMLAGGLTAENVGEAIRVVRPAAVDVASGVECQPGVKDLEKMRRFIGAARAAADKYLSE